MYWNLKWKALESDSPKNSLCKRLGTSCKEEHAVNEALYYPQLVEVS